MGTRPDPAARPTRAVQLPARAQVEALARDLLAGEGTRLRHVHTAGLVAARLSILFTPDEAELLVTAALLHDIGYSARIAHTGFHPLDGGVFLRAEGYPERLTRLVAHHSLAILTAPAHGIADLAARFPREDGLLADALAYADMHSAPDGTLTDPERRLADIAARHPDREHTARAHQLRAALTRVEAALLVAVPGTPGHEARIPPPRLGPDSSRHHPRQTTITGSAPPEVIGGVARADDTRPLRGAFHAWWYSESQYTLALELYQPGTEDRAEALRLARLRARADQRRDQYFRAALR